MELRFFRLDKRDDVAVIVFDQPESRVNTLTQEAMREFATVLDELERDEALRGAVLCSGKEDSFVVGADIKAFRTFESPEQVVALIHEGHALLNRLDALHKPVVAAVHGAAVGGGLELILACHYRVASRHPKTKFALPEVTLGLLPGLGGTQRLPRLVGVQQALDMALTGRSVYAQPALKMGLVDALSHPQGLVAAARAAVRGLVSGEIAARKAEGGAQGGLQGLRTALLERTPLNRLIYRQALETVQKKTRGNLPAPVKIIETIRIGQEQGMQAGLEAEARNFAELVFSPESKALVHLFFAKSAAEKNPYAEAARAVRTVGILGAGLMGSGIAQVSAEAGHQVILKDRNLSVAVKGKGSVWKELDKRVGKGRTAFERDLIDARITAVEDYAAFKRADLVIEAVLEDVELKRSVLKEVEAVAPEHLIFATNTSSIPIREIAAASQRPEQVIGMHYFSPVPKLPLLEIIKTDATPDWVLGTALQVGLQQGKTPIVVGDAPGFYTTRILALYMNEALVLLDEGARIQDVDRAMKDFGFPVGPITLLDEVGIDVGAKINGVLKAPFAERGIALAEGGEALMQAGFLGRKNRKGFYDYSSGKKGEKAVNEEVYRFFSAPRKEVARAVIQERLPLVMMNEAFRCLEEGVLGSPRDGDLGAVFGLGFPPFLGGPFWYADRLGLRTVVERLETLERNHGPRFRPAELLRERAAAARPFYEDAVSEK
jgi:3-hydroxyacyl-CoA dehydrogenase/enoyl-CoA hydratase/3-hydroxybutyryl-CoA epimerase